MEALEDPPSFLHSLPTLLVLVQVDELRGHTLMLPFKTRSHTIPLLCWSQRACMVAVLPGSQAGVVKGKQLQGSPTPNEKQVYKHRQGTLLEDCRLCSQYFPAAFLKPESLPYPLLSLAAQLKSVGMCNPHTGCLLISWSWWPSGLHSWAS